MTELFNPDIKTSSEMLPNLIDIIIMLIKYCDNNDSTNLMWISLIIKALCDILLLSNESTILQKGCSLLRFYISLCKDTIIKFNQIPLILKVIDRYFGPEIYENALLFLGSNISIFLSYWK